MNNIILRNLPNAITCVNLLCGVMAIILGARGDEPWGGLPAYQWAYIFIGIAAVADFLDGFAARLLKAYSNLGRELDSLCDLVSFGVAPAIILFGCLQRCCSAPWMAWWALLVPLFGALRLARFNVDTRQTDTFIGLPIPANAIFWIGFTSIAYQNLWGSISPWVWGCIIILESYMMVSPWRMMSLKFHNYRFRSNGSRYLLIFAALVIVGFFWVPGLFYLIVFYMLLSFCSAYTKK